MPTQTDLIRRERQLERARSTHRAVGSARAQSRVFGVDESQVSHWQNDRTEYSPIFRELETVRSVARARALDPMAVLAEALTVVEEERLRALSIDELLVLLARLREEEHDHQASEDRASQQRDSLRYITALKAEAAHQLYAAAVVEELLARGVDPLLSVFA